MPGVDVDEHDLADLFGKWNDDLDVDEEAVGEHGEDGREGEASESEDEEEQGDVEPLIGKRRRWAARKGEQVELSSEAARVLASDGTKFFEGPGTIRYVSLDGSEVRVEWDSQPGVHVAYPTGYRDRFHLRVYQPPVVEEIQEAKPVYKIKRIKPQLSAEERARVTAQAERRRQQRRDQLVREKEEREGLHEPSHRPKTTSSRSRSRGSVAVTPSNADRRVTPSRTPSRTDKRPPSIAEGRKSAATPDGRKSTATPGRRATGNQGGRMTNAGDASSSAREIKPAAVESLSSRGRYLGEHDTSRRILASNAQPILAPDPLQDQARTIIERLIGAEKQLERADILPSEKEQLLWFLTGFKQYLQEVDTCAHAGNTSLTRLRNVAESADHHALNLHISKARSYFSLADNICIILRRVRKLAYQKRLSPAATGDLPSVPEWGGKLRIQAEMEITKCVASAILVRKMRDANRMRTSDAENAATANEMNGTSSGTPVATQNNPSPNKSSNSGPKGKRVANRANYVAKGNAELNLMNEPRTNAEMNLLNEPDTPAQRPGDSLFRQTSPFAGKDSIGFQNNPENHDTTDFRKGVSREHGPDHLEKLLGREYIQDVKKAVSFLRENDDKLFTAARSAVHGGAGSLRVLLRTLETQEQVVHGNSIQEASVLESKAPSHLDSIDVRKSDVIYGESEGRRITILDRANRQKKASRLVRQEYIRRWDIGNLRKTKVVERVSRGSKTVDSQGPPQQARGHQQEHTKTFLYEIQEAMGPYLHRACVRTPMTGNTHMGGIEREFQPPLAAPYTLLPALQLQVRHDPVRPQTRQQQQTLMRQIEQRIIDRNTALATDLSSKINSNELQVSALSMRARANFERGLTPKLVPEGYRSRSVLGTSDTGWPKYRKSTVIN